MNGIVLYRMGTRRNVGAFIYMLFIYLAQNQSEESASSELNEKLPLWQEFSRQSRFDIELAEQTYCVDRNKVLKFAI